MYVVAVNTSSPYTAKFLSMKMYFKMYLLSATRLVHMIETHLVRVHASVVWNSRTSMKSNWGLVRSTVQRSDQGPETSGQAKGVMQSTYLVVGDDLTLPICLAAHDGLRLGVVFVSMACLIGAVIQG